MKKLCMKRGWIVGKSSRFVGLKKSAHPYTRDPQAFPAQEASQGFDAHRLSHLSRISAGLIYYY